PDALPIVLVPRGPPGPRADRPEPNPGPSLRDGPAERVSARQPTGDDPGRSHGRWRRRRFDLVRLERRIRPGPRPGPLRSRGRRERLDLRGPSIPESRRRPDLPRGRTSLAFVRPSDRSEEPRARERDAVGLRGRGDRLLRRTRASDRRRDG